MVFASSAQYTSFQLLLDCADHFLILAPRVRASKSFASSLAQGHRISALPLARAASSTWFGKRQNPHVRRTTSRSFGRAPEKVTRRNRRTRVTLLRKEDVEVSARSGQCVSCQFRHRLKRADPMPTSPTAAPLY